MTVLADMAAVPDTPEAPRHPWCRDFCAYLERAARAAAIAALAVRDEPGTLVLLPVFTWLPPAINTGRKTHNPDGPDFTLPVRLTYDTGEALILAPGQVAKIRVRALGMGHDLEGIATVTSVPGMPAGTVAIASDGNGLPVNVNAGIAVSVSREIVQAREDACLARWEAAMCFLRPAAEHETDRAISVLRSSSADAGSVSASIRDAVIDRLVYGISPVRGEEGKGLTGPPLLRLVDRCCEPTAFLRADPARIAAVTVRRDAFDAAQSVTGDTRLGVKLRSLADQLGPSITAPELASEANQRRLSAVKITEGKARIALRYVIPSDVALPSCVTGVHEEGH